MGKTLKSSMRGMEGALYGQNMALVIIASGPCAG
jgi:hypothetical protein